MFICKLRLYHTTTNIENGANRRIGISPQVEIANIPNFEILGEKSRQKDKSTNISIQNKVNRRINTLL